MAPPLASVWEGEEEHPEAAWATEASWAVVPVQTRAELVSEGAGLGPSRGALSSCAAEEEAAVEKENRCYGGAMVPIAPNYIDYFITVKISLGCNQLL